MMESIHNDIIIIDIARNDEWNKFGIQSIQEDIKINLFEFE